MMRTTTLRNLLATLLVGWMLLGCEAPPPAIVVEGTGIAREDEEAPVGAEQFGLPKWSEGDRFSFRKGGSVTTGFRVLSVDEGGYWVEEDSGAYRKRLGVLLGVVQQIFPNGRTRRYQPVDARFAWPLWVGKRWTSLHVRQFEGTQLTIRAEYEVEALEEISVPAGRFECLRIVRRFRPADSDAFLERTDVYWYAPEVGYHARMLESGSLLELRSYDLADPPDVDASDG